MDLLLDLLLQLLVGQEHGYNVSLKDRSMNPLEDSAESKPSEPYVLAEGIPDELGHEWRVLHPFEIPGVRFPTDNTPPNQRRLAENDALVELIQTTEYLEDTPRWGQRDYRLYPLRYGDPFYRGRGRGRGRGRRRRDWLRDHLKEKQMEDLEEVSSMEMEEEQ